MNNLPNSPISSPTEKPSRPRYQVIRELGCNSDRSRVTYLAMDNATQQQVVLKQFAFAQSGSEWAGFSVYKREIQRLLRLDRPGIPRYINCFETRNGFCLVQEYKKAQSLGKPRPFAPTELKAIAVSVLEILVYLQNQTPPIIHRNIKPENILIDEGLNVYLVDFSFSNISTDGSIKRSAAGTVGFMPREQLRDSPLTEATDLYSLGVTLACLMTQTPSSKIGTLMDASDRVDLSRIVPKEISHHFIEWLEKMTEPLPANRYPNAVAALEALKPIDIERSPEVKLKPASLEFTAAQYGTKVTQVVAVSNPIPDTLLKGIWKVSPHPQDPRRFGAAHAWITFKPASFQSNKIDCEITVDTRKLLANTLYERQILLQTNTSQPTHRITVRVKTGPLIDQKLPARSLGVLFAIALIGGSLGGVLLNAVGAATNSDLIQYIIGIAVGGVGGVGAAFDSIPIFGSSGTIVAAVSQVPMVGFAMGFGYFVGLVVGGAAGYVIRYNFGNSLSSGLSALLSGVLSFAGLISLLAATFGLSVGIELTEGLRLIAILALAVTGIPLGIALYRQYSQQAQIILKYRKSERSLIKP